MAREKVSIVKSRNAEYIVDRTFELLRPQISHSNLCLLKPNLSSLRKAETGATTHPELVEALVNRLRDRCSEVAIVESDTAATSTEAKFRFCGYDEVSKRTGAKLLNLTNEKRVDHRFEHANLKLSLPQVLFDCDCFVSVPTLKTHVLTVFTANIKNLYGLLPYPRKTTYHGEVNEIVAELNALVKPRLCFVDGIVAMEGNGPNVGDPAGFGVVVGGTNSLCVDAVSCHAIGLDPAKVRHLKLAASYLNAKFPRLKDIDIVGNSLEEVRRNFRRAPQELSKKDWLKDNLMAVKPVGVVLDATLLPLMKNIRNKRTKRERPSKL
ncbi:MAG: DUF362 domain-containing protein [Candidatus Bathyarchaeia archaeon]